MQCDYGNECSVIIGPGYVSRELCNVITGTWNVNSVPWNVNTGPCNVVMGQCNVIMGP